MQAPPKEYKFYMFKETIPILLYKGMLKTTMYLACYKYDFSATCQYFIRHSLPRIFDERKCFPRTFQRYNLRKNSARCWSELTRHLFDLGIKRTATRLPQCLRKILARQTAKGRFMTHLINDLKITSKVRLAVRVN